VSYASKEPKPDWVLQGEKLAILLAGTDFRAVAVSVVAQQIG